MSSTSRTPRVSICVPNLNTRPFLPDRFQTILDQSFQDWELLVYDSYSTDGAWDYFGELAAREPRMRIWQGPREGAPASWNPCIREAPRRIRLRRHERRHDASRLPRKAGRRVGGQPGLRHRALPVAGHRRARPRRRGGITVVVGTLRVRGSSGPLLHQPHVRRAPFDGMLHLLGGAVYISITQLLIRRALFDRIGMFESQWGSVSDFNWEMRAGLVANTIHVPDTWGGWRLHAAQATASASFGSEEHGQKIDSMIDHAVATCRSKLEPPAPRHLSSWVARAKDLRKFNRELVRHPDDTIARRRFIVAQLVTGSAAARAHVLCKLSGRVPEEFHERLRNWLEYAGVGALLCRCLRWLRKTRSPRALRRCGLARTQFVNRVSRKFSDMPSILYLAPCSPGKTFGQASRVAQIVSGLKAIGKVDLVVVKAAEWLLEVPPGCGVINLQRDTDRSVWRSFRGAFDARFMGAEGLIATESDRASIMDMLPRYDLVWIHSLRVADALQRWQWPRSVMDIDDVGSTWIQTELESSLGMAGRFRTWVRWHAARRRERLFGDRFTALSVCSDVDREYLSLRQKVHVIPNGFAKPEHAPPRRVAHPPHIGFIGTLEFRSLPTA